MTHKRAQPPDRSNNQKSVGSAQNHTWKFKDRIFWIHYNMKVKELIKLLQSQNLEAPIIIEASTLEETIICSEVIFDVTDDFETGDVIISATGKLQG